MKIFNKIVDFFDILSIKTKASKLGLNEKVLFFHVAMAIKNETYSVENAEYRTMNTMRGDVFIGSYKIVFDHDNLSIAIDHPTIMSLSSKSTEITIFNKDKNEVKDFTKYKTELLTDEIVRFLKKYDEKRILENKLKDLQFLK